MLSPKIKQARRARSKSMVLGELSRVSRPCSPLDQERALKSGWLKRQRSIMKNWQLRWFVLRPEALYFYKDQDETKAQGCIPLQGSQVNELPANQEEPGRHLFEIVPGGGGEKDRTGVSHETFLLMANSQSDMEEWVRAIRRAIWAPLGGGIFGQHLEETMVCEGGQQCGAPQRPVPVLVEQCVCFIREEGLQEEGLFRAPGQTNHVRELQDAFDRGEKPVFDSTTDVHTVASLLKLYIRELPEPIVPFSKYTQFLSCAQLLLKDKEMGIAELGKQVEALPQVNYSLLKYICKFLDEVQSHSDQNKMSVQNLATVFGPNILRPRVEDPVTMMEGSSHVQHLMTVLISEHARLYHREDPEPEVKNHSRGRAEWLAQDNTDSGPACPEPQRETPQPSHPSPDTNPSEPTAARLVPEKEDETQTEGKTRPAKAVAVDGGKSEVKAGSGSSGGGGAALSPSKQSKALPSWRCSLKGGPAGGQGAKGRIMGGSAGDVSGGGNWLMNGLSSLRAHRRTASSGERLKDSTLSLKETGTVHHHHHLALRDSHQSKDSPPLSHRALLQSHRLSAYDNVAGAPSSLSLPADTSGSMWSTFEISLADPPPPPAPEDHGSDQGPEQERPESEAVREGAGSSRGRSSADAAGTEADAPSDGKSQVSTGTNGHVGDLVLELKQELKRQRISYETCIRKLEESCAQYQGQVGCLEEELDQERKRFHMMEIRLRNSDRAHQDAESRNVHLQKEMEEFFTTLGDLTTRTPRTTATTTNTNN